MTTTKDNDELLFDVFASGKISRRVRNYIFSTGQPLLYRDQHGVIVLEFEDGTKEVVVPG